MDSIQSKLSISLNEIDSSITEFINTLTKEKVKLS